MTKTFLYENHVKLGAKMVDFAGWDMPVQYSSIIEEHNNVRNNAGLFDVSHMGEIFVSGKDSLAYLQSLVPQDVATLVDGKALYCQLTTETAGIVDDLLIFKLEDNNYFLVVNASRVDDDYTWFTSHIANFDVKVENKSSEYSMVALQGPKSPEILEKVGMPKTEQPKTFYIKEYQLLGVDVLISRTGYTGEDGFEIVIANEKVSELWETILAQGKEFNILPIGLGARDTLRLESAMSLYGHELNLETTPVEAGLSWTIARDKVEDYIGKNVILDQLKNGADKKLVAFKMIDRAIARNEYKIYLNDEEIGYVTSGCVAPSIGQNIGLGFVKTSKNLKINDTIQIMVRNKLYNAQITTKNFIQKRNKGN